MSFLAAAALTPSLSIAQAQNTTLGRGSQILINRGLQIQATLAHTDMSQLNGTNWAASNFTGINFAWAVDASSDILQSAPSIAWGRWGGGELLAGDETSFQSQLTHLQYGDEQDLTDPARVQETANGLAAWRTAYPGVLGFADQNGYLVSTDTLRNYMSIARPDMLMFNFYPFRGQAHGQSDYVDAWYTMMQKHRQLGAAGNDGTAQTPIPFGMYTQAWSPDGHAPSESEIRLNQFAAWTFGAKFLSAWVYSDVSLVGAETTALFDGPDDNNPTPAFHQMAETNRQSRNLGPALVRLTSTDVRFIAGRHANDNVFDSNGDANTVPVDLASASAGEGWGHAFITGASVENIGTVHRQNYFLGSRALTGDVMLGFFKVLDESFDGAQWNDQAYFMVLNALSTPDGSAEQTRQRITLDFDFGSSGITALQRLSRLTGQVETVPLIHDGGSQYHLELSLDGGAADLFKFDTGAPFIPEPAGAIFFLWLPWLVRRTHQR